MRPRPLSLSVLASLAVLGFVFPVHAKPPTLAAYERANGIDGRLQIARRRLQAEERFRSFPRMKKILISMQQGKTTFDGLELGGQRLVREVLKKWKPIQQPKADVSSGDLAILALLPAALKKRYPRGQKIDKLERFQASKALVDALMDERLHIREIAIESLKTIYDTSARMYQAAQSRRDRKTRKSAWMDYIKREKS